MRCIVHLDLDCFYAQVEARRVGVNCEVEPFLLVQWGMPLAVSYPARSFGISRSTHLNDAIKLCPHIKYTHTATYKIGESIPRYHPDANRDSHKVSLLAYRNASRQIFSVLKSFRGVEVEKGGVDEAFMDATVASREVLAMLESQFEAFLGSVGAGGNVQFSLLGLAAHLWSPPPPIQHLSNPKSAVNTNAATTDNDSADAMDLQPTLGQSIDHPSYSQADLQTPPPDSFCDAFSMSCASALDTTGLARDHPKARHLAIGQFLTKLNSELNFTNIWEPKVDDLTMAAHSTASHIANLKRDAHRLALPPMLATDSTQATYDALAADPINYCLLQCAAVITKLVRFEVRRRLGFNCSAGVSANKELSKCISAIHKPNQQTLLPPQHTLAYLADLPFQKLRGFGGKLGEQVKRAILTFYRQHILKYQFEVYQRAQTKRNTERDTADQADGDLRTTDEAIQSNFTALLQFISDMEGGKRRAATTGREGGGSGGSSGSDDDGAESGNEGRGQTLDENNGRGWGASRGGGRGRGGPAGAVNDYTTVVPSGASLQAPRRTVLTFGSIPVSDKVESSCITPTKLSIHPSAPTVASPSPQKVVTGGETTHEEGLPHPPKAKPKPPFLLSCRASWALPLDVLVFHLSGGTHTTGPTTSPEQLLKTAQHVFDLLRGEGSDRVKKRTVAKSLMSQKVLTSRDDLVGQTPLKLQRWVDCLAAELMERYDQLLEDNNYTLRAKTLKYQFGAGGLRDWSDIVNKQIPIPSQPLTAATMSKCAMDLLMPYFISHNKAGLGCELPPADNNGGGGQSPSKAPHGNIANEPFRAINCVTITICQFIDDAPVSSNGESVLGMLFKGRAGDRVKAERNDGDQCSGDSGFEESDDEDVIFTGYYKGKVATPTKPQAEEKKKKADKVTPGPQEKRRRVEAKKEVALPAPTPTARTEAPSPIQKLFKGLPVPPKTNAQAPMPRRTTNSRGPILTLSSDEDDSIQVIE